MTVEDTQVTGIVFSKDARKKLYNGLRLAAEAVSCTLGPNGKTVLIQNGDNSPIITKDGVTVSKSVRLPDPLLKPMMWPVMERQHRQCLHMLLSKKE